MKRRLKAALIILVIEIVIVAVFIGIQICQKQKTKQRHFELSKEFSFSFANTDDIIQTMHDGLTNHAQSFTITYRAGENNLGETKELIDEMMNYAMYNTDSPTEGDYVRYQYGGYELRQEKLDTGKGHDYQLIITPVYYSTVEEEKQVDVKVEKILKELNISKKASDLEKIQIVYDYVCNNVNYDYVHEHNSRYYKDSTAYAALVKKYASCQGYAVAVFRLLKEVGVECLVVTGTGIDDEGNSEFHAWNKVVVDGECYNLDATWDAGKTEYDFFLKKDEEFINHSIVDRQ